MTAPTTPTERDDALVRAVRDHLRLEIVATGHLAPGGAVHVSDHAVAAHVGARSNLNRATCLSVDQPDLAFGEISRFFDGRPHTLWVDADAVDDAVDEVIRAHGYVGLHAPRGVACTALPGHTDGEPDGHAELLSDPAEATAIAEVVASGFGLGVEDRLVVEDLARAILRHARPWDHGAVYGVRRDGELVSVAALLCTRDVAGLSGVFTVPAHRDHHHASATIRRALNDARALGYRIAVTMATPDSQGTLAKLGFRHATDVRVYRPLDATGPRS